MYNFFVHCTVDCIHMSLQPLGRGNVHAYVADPDPNPDPDPPDPHVLVLLDPDH